MAKWALMIAGGLLLAVSAARADDAGARHKIERAVQAESEGNHFDAANLYRDAELLADDITIKANCLVAAAQAYRKSEWYYKEFECNEILLRAFPASVNVARTVDRQFELGDLYYQGYREPAASWLKWTGIGGKNHAIEIYEKALARGRFSARAPQAKLRLARLMIDRNEIGDVDKALDRLRDLIKDHPKTLEQKNGRLELANILTQRVFRGDASDQQTEEARLLLNLCLEEYATDPEFPWIRDTLTRLDEASAKRLLTIARYYERIGNDAGVAFNLRKLMDNYNRTESAKEAEKTLGRIQPSLTPPPSMPAPDSRPLYQVERPYFERRDILAPPAPGSKHLLILEDYTFDIERNRASREERIKREADWRKKGVPGGGNGLPPSKEVKP